MRIQTIYKLLTIAAILCMALAGVALLVGIYGMLFTDDPRARALVFESPAIFVYALFLFVVVDAGLRLIRIEKTVISYFETKRAEKENKTKRRA